MHAGGWHVVYFDCGTFGNWSRDDLPTEEYWPTPVQVAEEATTATGVLLEATDWGPTSLSPEERLFTVSLSCDPAAHPAFWRTLKLTMLGVQEMKALATARVETLGELAALIEHGQGLAGVQVKEKGRKAVAIDPEKVLNAIHDWASGRLEIMSKAPDYFRPIPPVRWTGTIQDIPAQAAMLTEIQLTEELRKARKNSLLAATRVLEEEVERRKAPAPAFSPNFADLLARHPGCLLLFRDGSSYIFLHDAHAEEAVQCGVSRRFPLASLEMTLAKLLKAGKRVAVCEQTESGQQATEHAQECNPNPGDVHIDPMAAAGATRDVTRDTHLSAVPGMPADFPRELFSYAGGPCAVRDVLYLAQRSVGTRLYDRIYVVLERRGAHPNVAMHAAKVLAPIGIRLGETDEVFPTPPATTGRRKRAGAAKGEAELFGGEKGGAE
jgi:hypothetical protein